MKYGHFSPDGREFIITSPNTPRPWINYLTNEKYCAIISSCAGGYSFFRDCRSDRILRWLPENWHFDRPGRYIYCREKNKTWSLTYQPLRVEPDFYRCRHGLGYTVIETQYNGIHSEITYFVPEEDDCEVWLVKITNQTRRKRTLELFPYAEFLIGDYHQELRYRNIMNLYNRVWFDKAHQAVFAKKTAAWGDMNIKPFPATVFFASSLAVGGYITRKLSFLGKFNTEENPEAVFSGKFKNFAFCSGEDGVGALKHNLNLGAAQTKEFTIILGQTEGVPSVSRHLNKYRDLNLAKSELKKTQALWEKRIVENIVVKTPDKDFNTLVNVWLKYQLYICNFWSRSPSYYHEGSGGRGYRDSCQDSESIVSINSQLTRKRILKIASLIRKDGTSAPGWSDTTGPAKHRPNKDHQVWLTATVSSYIKETGDKDILLEYVPYLKDHWIKGWEIEPNWKQGSISDGEGTLFEHLERNLNFCFNDVGEKGLPLIGHADWNDAIDAAGIKGKGESAWLAEALVRSLKLLAELAELIGEKEKQNKYLHMAKTMSERINNFAWDGSWYQRGFTDDGTVYGSKADKEGRIFINTQSWAILSGVAEGERLKQVLKSTDKYLDGPHGLALFQPAYSQWNPKLGRISMFSEGTKENAAVFCHAANFMIVAYCLAGCGQRAYDSLCKLMPNKQKDYDLYKTEPYVFAEYLVGPQHPYLYGEGAFTWITGSCGWAFMAATEWMLGARRDYEGLRIDPCIPKHWKKYFIQRPFRGALYAITIENPKGKEKGVKEVYVDGRRIPGNLIPPHNDAKTHQVRVVMG
ncbi:MAG: GH36-type glycosyl hydrolase domain-containing protein [Candidatus Omnitrophota bacterium]